MKYMLLIYDNPNSRELAFSDQGKTMMQEIEALMAEITESGELLATDALADPAATKTVRADHGVPVVTDGPLAETKEHFGGYLLVDCESIERATQIASRWPSVQMAPLEVRPIMDAGGSDV
jgi:hypothetical protein